MIKFFFFYESLPWFYHALSALYLVLPIVHTSLTCLLPLFSWILPLVPSTVASFYSIKPILTFS